MKKLAAISLAVMMVLTSCTQEDKTLQAGERQRVMVSTASLEKHHFRHQICVPGCIQPVNSAKIASRMAGTMDFLHVKEGDHVKKGDILFQTDQKNLHNQVAIAEQSLKVAQENRRMMQSDLKISQTNLEKAKLDFERDQTLFKRDVITKTAFENTEVAWKNALATVEKAESSLAYQDVAIAQAQTNLEIARKNLEDSIIRAPYDGVITAKLHEPGEYLGVGTAVLSMEDHGNLELSVYLSSLYYQGLSLETPVVLSVHGREVGRAKLTYISPCIEPLTRTFEIKAFLSRQDNIVSGMLCDATVILEERDGMGLPTDAVMARADGKYAVFAVNGDVAEELPVETGFTTDGYTEVLNVSELDGREIVVSGQYFLNDGGLVSRQGGNEHDDK